jgi:arsenate reductase
MGKPVVKIHVGIVAESSSARRNRASWQHERCVKKVRIWLEAQGLAYQFHDFKKEGVDPEALAHWLDHVDWETLVNRKGTTWRQLGPETQAQVHDAASARDLMLAHPSVIKRPVLVAGPQRKVRVGVNETAWSDVTSS